MKASPLLLVLLLSIPAVVAAAERAPKGREAAPATVQEPFVRVDPRRALGDASARVAIVEFADYQCPYCRAFHVSDFPQLQQRYITPGKVRYFYMDFPLERHRQAMPAAIAARCAGAQGRYWQMHDLLYTEQARLGGELYEELAGELSLDLERFNACRRSPSARAAVADDLLEGRRLAITGTPSFLLGYVEGDRVVIKRTASGLAPLDVFTKELDALLTR